MTDSRVPTSEGSETAANDPGLAAWLRDQCGVEEPRRVVRRSSGVILVSKFDAGFAARLYEAIALLPDVFEDEAVAARYREIAADEPGAERVETWRRAVRSLLEEHEAAGVVDGARRAEIEAGVDSVAALVASVLWSSPVVGDGFVAGAAEHEAYQDALARMDADPGMFTRYYGMYEGAAVVNHCPGAPLARRLVAQAWRICGQSAPAGG